MPPAFIYFDLGNVVCFFDRDREVRQVAAVSGVAGEKVREVLLGKHGVLWPYERGEFDDPKFYDAFGEATDSRPDMAALLEADADIFTLNGGIVPLVAHLQDAQIPLGILSNICPSHWRKLTELYYGILPDAFQKRILSFEAGASKPDERIFHQAIETAGVPAEKIFYVDDTLGHVTAAKKLGIDAVQYTTTDALAQELLKRGVRCNF